MRYVRIIADIYVWSVSIACMIVLLQALIMSYPTGYITISTNEYMEMIPEIVMVGVAIPLSAWRFIERILMSLGVL